MASPKFGISRHQYAFTGRALKGFLNFMWVYWPFLECVLLKKEKVSRRSYNLFFIANLDSYHYCFSFIHIQEWVTICRRYPFFTTVYLFYLNFYPRNLLPLLGSYYSVSSHTGQSPAEASQPEPSSKPRQGLESSTGSSYRLIEANGGRS